jgi:hypothetical protein
MADKDKASGRVWRSRLRALDSLQISIEVLKKECIRLEKKIEEQGLEGRYSINSDILRWARRAHSCCYELSILHVVQEQIDNEYDGRGLNHDKKDKNKDSKDTELAGSTSISSQSKRWWTTPRQEEGREQESMPRTGAAMIWRYLEAALLISAGLGLGFLLFGYP